MDIDIESEGYQPFLKMYNPPSCKMSMGRIKTLLYQRFTVLSCINDLNDLITVAIEKKKQVLIHMLQEHGLETYVWWLTKDFSDPITEAEHALHRDYNISYLLLQTIIKSDVDTFRWIEKNETQLIIWKYITQPINFLKVNGVVFEEVSLKEKRRLKEELASCLDIKPMNVRKSRYFKIPWYLASNIFSNNEGYLSHGFCYVIEEKLQKIIGNLCHHHIKQAEQSGFLDSVRVNILGQGRALYLYRYVMSIIEHIMREDRKTHFAMSKIEEFKPYFPPCIRFILKQLETKYHLKHEARKLLAIFLRLIGADADEAVHYIKKFFLKHPECTEHKWNSEYDYFFYHVFGLRGNRIIYKMGFCSTYLRLHEMNQLVGCPFGIARPEDIEDLGRMCKSWNIGGRGKLSMFKNLYEKQYSETCATAFKSLHGVYPDSRIISPMDYYQQSLHHKMLEQARSVDTDNEILRIMTILSSNLWQQSTELRSAKSQRCDEYQKDYSIAEILLTKDADDLIEANKIQSTVQLDLQAMNNFLLEQDEEVKLSDKN